MSYQIINTKDQSLYVGLIQGNTIKRTTRSWLRALWWVIRYPEYRIRE